MKKILYKKKNDKIQVWKIRTTRNKIYTEHGYDGGKMVESKPTICLAKNVAKSNEICPDEQAILEANSRIKSKLESGYVENKEDLENNSRFTPMLAHLYEENKDKIEYPCFVQPKLDGIRCNINKDGMWSRKGKRIISCPHIFESVKEIFEDYPDLVLDGELYNHDLRDDFNKISSLVKKQKPTKKDLEETKKIIQFHWYDIFNGSSEHTKSLTFKIRNYLIRQFDEMPYIEIVRTFECKTESLIDADYKFCRNNGYEGAIIRNNTSYIQNRTVNLLKRKDWKDDEFEIIDITEGFGNRSGMMGRIVMKTKEGNTFESDCTGMGGHEFYKELLKNKHKYIGQFATVKYQNLTPDRNIPRFGKVIAIRDLNY